MALDNLKEAHGYWTLARKAAPKGSAEHALAGQGMRSTGGDSLTYLIVGGLLAFVLASFVFAVWKHRKRQIEEAVKK